MQQSITLPFSAACERNKDAIGAVLSDYLRQIDSVLEVGSGTAQHALHFAQTFPHLKWQTSDQEEYLAGIKAQIQHSKLSNVLMPIKLDVKQSDWCQGQRFEAVYTANTLHIMNEVEVEAFFAGLVAVLADKGWLFIYGPFKYQQQFTSDSNQQFDQRLRERGVGSGIRDFEWLNEMASLAGLVLRADVSMPANNQCLVWQLQGKPIAK